MAESPRNSGFAGFLLRELRAGLGSGLNRSLEKDRHGRLKAAHDGIVLGFN